MNKFILKEVLEQINNIDWKLATYTKRGIPFNENTLIYIAHPDEDEKDVGVLEVDGGRFYYALSIQTIQDVVENAKQQKPNASLEELIKALNFYYKHDAFIDFKKRVALNP